MALALPGTRRNHPDTIVAIVRDIEVAGPIHRDPRRALDQGFRCRPAIPRKPALASRADHRGDDPVRIHLADITGVALRYIEIARRIERQTRRIPQRRADGQSAIASAVAQAVAGHYGDDAVGRDLEHHGKSTVGEIDVALSVDSDVVRIDKMGGCGGFAGVRKQGVAAGVSIDGALGQHEAGEGQERWQQFRRNHVQEASGDVLRSQRLVRYI